MLISVIDVKGTGLNILRLRKKKGLSVREVQTRLGIATPQAVYKWQRGETLPSMENLIGLAYLLGVGLEDLLAVKVYEK